jgi:CO/xanthine dehydrogenase Mo-binding subunit
MTTHARAATGPLSPSPIGESVPRRDGRDKVTGAARFTADLIVPGMARAKILRSPYAHARIRSIDASAARAHGGVIAVVSAADLPDVNLYYGHAVADHPILADGVVRYAGEAVVGVVAEDLISAEEALALVQVDYEPLTAVTSVEAALAEGAPILHEREAEQRPNRGFEEHIEREHPNVCSTSRQRWGDIEAAFEGAHLVLKGTYRYPNSYAFAMEPYTAVAQWTEGALQVWSSCQHPFMVRDDLARCFRLPLSRVRVVVPYVGGGYGSKSYTKIEPLTAALALRAGRPVKLALSIEESILTTRGDGAAVTVRSAFDAEGHLRGRQAEILLNSGAYAENSPLVGRKAANRIAGPYRIPAVDVTCHVVYTNTSPASSFRGFGAPQGNFAAESQMDEAADLLGFDALEIRRRNVVAPGEPPWPKVRGLDADLDADLCLVAEELDWWMPPSPGRGRAIGISASDAGSEPVTTSLVRVSADGSVTVTAGSTEIGQGSSTVLPQIAAGELGVPLDRVQLLQSDTTAVSFDRSTGASRTTTIMGLGIQAAAHDARRQLVAWAEEALADGDVVVEVPGGVRIGETIHDWGSVVRAWFGGSYGECVGRGYVRREGRTQQMPPFWEIGCVGVEVSVDEDTGVVTVERLVTVGDVGCAINPQLVESQDLGAAIMGLGMALGEELVYTEDGTLLGGGLVDYRVPRASDIPRVTSILAERGDGVGVYGAKGGGEGAVNPIAGAVANAVKRATGVRVVEAPLTPERVWRALQERDRTSG